MVRSTCAGLLLAVTVLPLTSFADAVSCDGAARCSAADIEQSSLLQKQRLKAVIHADHVTQHGVSQTASAVDVMRTTTSGCNCRKEWRASVGGLCTDFCCNPDQDPDGEWCFVAAEDCQGSNWGYCSSAAGAGGSTVTGSGRITAISVQDMPASTSSYELGTDPFGKDYMLVRRCSSLDIRVSALVAATESTTTGSTTRSTTTAATETTETTATTTPPEAGTASASTGATATTTTSTSQASLLQARARRTENTTESEVETAKELQAYVASHGSHGKASCEGGANRASCDSRKQALEVARERVADECPIPLPRKVPYQAIAHHLFCADTEDHSAWAAELEACLLELQPLDDEIVACDLCRSKEELLQQGAASSSSVQLAAEERRALEEAQAAKRRAWERLQEDRDRAAGEWWKKQEEELHNTKGTRRSMKPVLGLSEEAARFFMDADAPWPSTLNLTVLAHRDGNSLTPVTTWTARLKPGSVCGSSDQDCTYTVSIPCDAMVGLVRLNLGLPDGGMVEAPSSLYVTFNAFAPADEVYMEEADRLPESSYLQDTVSTIWRGSYTSNAPSYWRVDQFDASVVRAVMKLTSMIPFDQRGQAPRVSRWLAYLVNNQVVQGNWCSEPGCMDNGTRPGVWTGSKPIYEEWLSQESRVKYGQCWVFAGVLASATRSLGLASRIISNFDSAHGRPPYNKGIDDFFYVNESLMAEQHVNEMESIWNFHVWNEVWMRRNDLPSNYSADGWQVIDSTPQEQSCEIRGGSQVCRHMVGPAPKSIILNRSMETQGRETSYDAVGAGFSYDTMFVFGEVDGDWRGWRPARRNFTGCPETCDPNWRGDGYCDQLCNTAGCDFDMGDCCEDSCTKPVDGVTIHRRYPCGNGGYTCRGQAEGWELFYRDTTYIGRRISTQRIDGYYWLREPDFTSTYKRAP